MAGIRLRLLALYIVNQDALTIREKGLKEGWKYIDEVLHQETLPYMPEIIKAKLISRHHDNLLAGHFDIKKS